MDAVVPQMSSWLGHRLSGPTGIIMVGPWLLKDVIMFGAWELWSHRPHHDHGLFMLLWRERMHCYHGRHHRWAMETL